MKELALTRGYVALIDDEDYERVAAFKWYPHEDASARTVYAGRSTYIKKGQYGREILHRVITGVTDPKIQVDHEDHNGLNCQKYNLRVCSQQQNLGNQRKTRGTSKYKGVCRDKHKWAAYIGINRKSKHLGYFAVEEDAARAYDKAARETFGEFACLNFPMMPQHLSQTHGGLEES